MSRDNGPRENQSLEALAGLTPYFDKRNGTVTAGNSSQLTDGAAALLVMSESGGPRSAVCSRWGTCGSSPTPRWSRSAWAWGRSTPTSLLLEAGGAAMRDIDYVEINEAFAAQVIACEIAFGSDGFARELPGEGAGKWESWTGNA